MCRMAIQFCPRYSFTMKPPRGKCSIARMNFFAICLCLTSVVFGVASSGATDNENAKISIRLSLSETVASIGESIPGIVTITNRSRRPILIHACASDGWLLVGLSDSEIHFQPVFLTIGCTPSIYLEVGVNKFPVELSTLYQHCSQSSKETSVPRCSKTGMPHLPKGHYRASVYFQGLPKGVSSPKTQSISLR